MQTEGVIIAVTSIDIDQDRLRQAKELAGTTSNRETVDLALRTLIAVRRQPAAVERIIGAASSLSSYIERMSRRDDVQRVLAGEAGYEYDRLAERDQAAVRAGWDEELAKRRATLNLAAEFEKLGRSWSEADAEGHLVRRLPHAPDA